MMMMMMVRSHVAELSSCVNRYIGSITIVNSYLKMLHKPSQGNVGQVISNALFFLPSSKILSWGLIFQLHLHFPLASKLIPTRPLLSSIF